MKEFVILETCNLSESKELVLSKNNEGNYVLAKRFCVNDNGERKYFYEKGATIIQKEIFETFLENIYKKVLTTD